MTDEPHSTPFADHFSGVSNSYAAFRPSYPEALFDALADIAPSHALAWDCGAGTGQATLPLTQRFASVLATDASEEQIAQAPPHGRVTYRVAPAHESELPEGSVGLITVAQALHWFDVDAFHCEAQRVLVHHGIIAEWTYALAEVPSLGAITELITAFNEKVSAWWPPERQHVVDGYATLSFPFNRVDLGNYAMEADWSPEQLVGYLGTWSAVSHMRKETGVDPLLQFGSDLERVWGRVPLHRFKWPLTLRVGRNEAPPPPSPQPQPPPA